MKMQTSKITKNKTAENCASKPRVYKRFFKRPIDVILSFCAIVVLSPVLLMIAVLVRIKLGGPVIFKQKRPGMNEKVFTLYKFRTMTNEKDEYGCLLPNNLRSTKFGNVLRKFSLDELPELFNIFKGDMSIVGPRPLIVEYLPYYTDEERQRHVVKPGLTGLAQTRGRSFMRWEEKFALDIEYVQECSFLLDFGIVLRTIKLIFKHDDVANFDELQKDNIGTYIRYQGYKYRRLDEERNGESHV